MCWGWSSAVLVVGGLYLETCDSVVWQAQPHVVIAEYHIVCRLAGQGTSYLTETKP